jgi:hypothetical protein
MKVSFDYDNTLERFEVQQIALAFLKTNAEVWIVTSRHEKSLNNSVLLATADAIGIPRSRILFTNYELKADYLDSFTIHFDDDVVEIEEILSSGIKCIGAHLPIKVKPNYRLP